MKMLITGAAGFLGKYVIAAAREQNHSVKALVRPTSKNIPEKWNDDTAIEIVKGDLRRKDGLSELLKGCDVVLHLAALKAGDLYDQFGSTVIATENLLAAMKDAHMSRLVVISSFSVYEYMKRMTWGSLNETSPLAKNPSRRDEYCQTKLIQEKVCYDFAKENDFRCMILRPGVIFGKDNLWTARLGMQASEKKWIAIGRFAPLPLTYVENCAQAIIKAAEYSGVEKTVILNVVDDKCPSQRSYIRFLKQSMPIKPRVIVVPLFVFKALAWMARLFNIVFLGGNGKIPGLFVPERLHARSKPLRYSNKLIKSLLGWKPQYSWKEGVLRSLSTENESKITGRPADIK